MQYDKIYKEKAVRLSDEIGQKKVANQLGIPYHTLTYWRRTKSHYGQQAFPGSDKARIPKEVAEQRIRELEKEICERLLTQLMTDISQIPCQDSKLYMSHILDYYDGEILALEMWDNI